ncbi:calcium ion binding protein [Aureococcus anophagefferens]|nr:calcium ion binding protein [Aureococcus anophagefferens]
MTILPMLLALLIFAIGRPSPRTKHAREVRTQTFGWFLLLTFVVFPRVSASCGRDDFESFSPRKGRKIVTDALGRSVSATVLRFYNCVSFDEGLADGSTETLKVLEADFDISCTSSSYKGAWSAYALIMMFIAIGLFIAVLAH